MHQDRTSADNSTVARRTLVVIGIVLATLLVLLVGYETRRALTWIVISIFFAVALHPAVSLLERKIGFVRRWLATLLVFLLAFAVIAGLVTLFVVPLAREGARLVDNFPQIVADIRAGRGPIGNLAERFNVLQYAEQNADRIREYASNLGAPTLAFLRGAATTVAGIVTIFVLSYLMVLEGPRIINGFLGLFDERRANRIRRVGQDCARTVTGYLTGNLLISVICGVLTYAVLRIVGVPFAGIIALFVGLADLIPLIGATLGAIVAALAGFAHSTTAGIVVLVFFVVYQQLENHLLQPVILSRTVKLNPLTVLVSILLAVELAGILGALLAIPVAGILQTVARDLWDGRRGRLKTEPTVGEDRTPAGAVPPGDDGEPAAVGAATASAGLTSPRSTPPGPTSPGSASPPATTRTDPPTVAPGTA